MSFKLLASISPTLDWMKISWDASIDNDLVGDSNLWMIHEWFHQQMLLKSQFKLLQIFSGLGFHKFRLNWVFKRHSTLTLNPQSASGYFHCISVDMKKCISEWIWYSKRFCLHFQFIMAKEQLILDETIWISCVESYVFRWLCKLNIKAVFCLSVI